MKNVWINLLSVHHPRQERRSCISWSQKQQDQLPTARLRISIYHL